MFSYLSPEQRVKKDHPLRLIRAVQADEVMKSLSPVLQPDVFLDRTLRRSSTPN